MSGRVAERVAESIDEEPLELSPPLYDVIDTDALNSLFRSGGEGVVVSFEYQGCSVIVDDGFVAVYSPEDDPSSAPMEESDGPPVRE